MRSTLIDVHPSWIDLPNGIETSNSFRWFHLGVWAEDAIYEAVLTHFADRDALTGLGVMNMLALSTEALTRSGTAVERCHIGDVEWARRCGLALFGAAVFEASWVNPRSSKLAASQTVVRHLLTHLPDGERTIALLAMPCEGYTTAAGQFQSSPSIFSGLPSGKLRRLIQLCRERVKHGMRREDQP